MSDPVFDKEEQLQQIQGGLMQGESIIAAYGGIGAGTGFIGPTSHRVIFQDKSFVGKKVAITSIPVQESQAYRVTGDPGAAAMDRVARPGRRGSVLAATVVLPHTRDEFHYAAMVLLAWIVAVSIVLAARRRPHQPVVGTAQTGSPER
jgi:hypothetical protein